MAEPVVGVACVGAGAWGKNQVRVFAHLPRCALKYVVDSSPAILEQMALLYHQARCTGNLQQALDDPAVQAVVVATPAPGHYAIARAALEAGKDVFIEKPMVLDPAQGEELIELAEERRRLIQVGHLLLFHPAVTFLKKVVDQGELGEVHYIYTQRLNLGTVRSDENALWSLAPHDLSVANYLLDALPEGMTCDGACYLQEEIEDVVFLNLRYPGGRLVHTHVSWLDPHKTRCITLVGSRKMAVFDDMEPADKVRIYDKGIKNDQYANFQERFGVRTGDILIPNISNAEPLRLQAEHFVRCVAQRSRPLIGGQEGLSVVRILQQADAILRRARRARASAPEVGAGG